MSFDWSTSLRTAERHLSRGRIHAAIEEYRKLVNWDPSDLTILNTLGDLYVRVGSTEQAKPIFSRVAQGYRHQGFTSKAIAILKKLLRIDPNDLDSAVSLAQCYAKQGLRGEAVRLYEDVAEAYKRAGLEDKALEMHQHMAEIDPSNISRLMMLGERWLREGLKQRAYASFAAAGEELCRQKKDQQALMAYLKAQDAQPDDIKTLSAITSICTARGQANSAIPILRDSLSRNPGDPGLLKLLGSASLSAGQLDEAEETYQRLLTLDPGAYRNLLALGERFLDSGDLDRAVQQIDGFVDSLIANRTEYEAVDFLKRALASDPQHPSSLRRLARIFRELREDFNLTPILSALAESALRRGDRDEAIGAFIELCALQPHEQTHRDALERLGVHPTASRPAVSSNTESGWEYSSTNDRELHLALKQIYSSEDMSGSDPNNRFGIGGDNPERWPLTAAAHEFIAVEDIRSVYSLQQDNITTPADADLTVTDFELLPSRNRRRNTRVSARVPVVVISESGGWREFTEAVEVSDSGLTLQLAHPIAPSTSLRVLIEMTKWPERVALIRALRTTNGIVRHCLNRPGKSHLVGIEFHHGQEYLPIAETISDSVM